MTDQKNKQHPADQQHKNDHGKQSGKQQSGDKHKGTHKAQQHEDSDPDEEPVTESDFNPDKKIEVDDDPEGTRRKIPNMKK